MTKMHFIAFARAVNETLQNLDPDPNVARGQRMSCAALANAFAAIAQGQNDRFDRDRFLVACGLR